MNLVKTFLISVALASSNTIFSLAASAAILYTFEIENNPNGDGSLEHKIDIVKDGKKTFIDLTIESSSLTLSEVAEDLAGVINQVFPNTATAINSIVELKDVEGVSWIQNNGDYRIKLNKEEFLADAGGMAGDLSFLSNPESGVDTILTDATVIAGFNDGPGGLDLVSFDVFNGTKTHELANILNDNLSTAGYNTKVKDSTVWVFADGALEPTRLDFSIIPVTSLTEDEEIQIAIDGYVGVPESSSIINLFVFTGLGLGLTLKEKIKTKNN